MAAIEEIKPGIPGSLKIDGHNPLTLLHDALSEGLHAESDAECLEFAGAIRGILIHLAVETKQALQDRNELKKSIGVLLNKKSGQK